MNVKSEVKRLIRAINEKYSDNLVSLVQMGSSLRPNEMFPESDLDFVAILRRAPKDRFSIGHELRFQPTREFGLHMFSKRQFVKELKEGRPIPLMSVKYGRIVLDDGFLERLGSSWEPTELTFKLWYDHGWTAWSRAICDLICADDCCYLRDCHHAARNFLRAWLLRKRRILCGTDKEILENISKEFKSDYSKLMKWRMGHSYTLDFMKMRKLKTISERSRYAKPLFTAERLITNIVSEIENKRLRSLIEVIADIDEPYDHIALIFAHRGKRRYERSVYYVTLVKPDEKMKHLRMRLFER
jgi:hypothetical protein